jgi:hypothetical protein
MTQASSAVHSPPAKTAAVPRRERALDAGVADVLRLGAACVIVLFHAGLPVGGAMTAALGVFTALVVVTATAAPPQPLGHTIRRRARRLLRPFALWGGMLLLLRLADAALSGLDIGAELRGFVPPEGTFAQLWFLPFAFALSLAVAALRPHAAAAPPPAVAIGLAALVSVAWIATLAQSPMPEGLRVFFNFVPAAAFGLVLAALRHSRAALAAAGLAAAGLGLWLGAQGLPETEQLTLGIPLVALALIAPRPRSVFTRLASELSMAVYLCHVVLIAVLFRLLPLDYGSPALGLAALAAALGLSLALVLTRAGRRLI